MTGLYLVLAAVIFLGSSGIPACFFPRASRAGQKLTIGLMLIGSSLGLAGTALVLLSGENLALSASWFLPWGRFSVAIDGLSAFFLVLVWVVPTLGSFYGLGYWPQAEHQQNGRKLGLSYGLLAGAMALVVISRDGILFLLAWEIMALAAFFAATTEDDQAEVRRAGWIYLVATHVGTLFLLAMFALWSSQTGSFDLDPALKMGAESAGLLFVLGLVGFGVKAGIMPLHVWLPGAHANAPSHVSALMSGVMLKMGIYGIIRLTGLLPVGGAWWGFALLIAGMVSGIAGIAFALGQQDIKRLLAYSSIENIGIILMGLGLALLGRFYHRADWLLLGLGGALLHVWNHGLFKPLLFLNAGAIIHATHTRDSDRLGGLGQKMPRTMTLFLIGAVAISALPPLNGFVSEWLIYQGLFRTLEAGAQGSAMGAAAAAAALAMIGALALACFVKLGSTVFLGAGRSGHATQARDPGRAMLAPMLILAIACLAIACFPWLVTPFLDAAIAGWAGSGFALLPLAILAPASWLGMLGLVLLAGAGLAALGVRCLPRLRRVPRRMTWDCGYAQPTSRMQYTGSSFTQTIAGLFNFILRAKQETPAVDGAFPRPSRFSQFVPDLVLDRLLLPLARFIGRHALRIRVMQQGQTHFYILYILVITIVLLVCTGLRGLP